ncbi:magnesium chelatase family protein [Kitasatospora sp. SolWspMP-SS2h]|uniref:YifB family Mg chelatase-like AAA ATPase n=1 Tax=Kitasatospora sp. SolWspMP-SS2h TaxID=1305729 RepID=UPI000DBA5CBA|nr:YifB family Mg chelatase-like AAA ATPase [Kitasatospora sp. SolWspMP-SS2h]RAJ34093.1 magnesium chelatase family protein [Kitasatospora sp. SolWspMP-SS2h]
MAFARTCSVALVGVDGVVVEVQADLEPGLAAFSLVGLADKALLEARDRVRAAVSNSGEKWPLRKLTVGLTPASVPKSGSGYDLAVACAVLAAAERLDPASIDGLLIIGELGLDGRVRPVRGVLPAVLAAADAGYRQIVVAEQTAAEAKLVPGVSVLGVRSLRQLIAILTNAPVPDEPPDPSNGRPDSSFAGLLLPGLGVRDLTSEPALRPDLADVAGQYEARQALEIAAAGGHHLYLKGPPGAGKTMLAERLPALLPPLTSAEALEVTAIHSVAGLLPSDRPLIDTPPYCAPHHSTTMPAIIGGGTGLPRPGAVSLAHRGVLFLDEAPEFPVRVLDALRQPLESGEVMIARAAGSMRLPARFLLCLAANPCPCGRYSLRGEGCECTPVMVNRYQARLSGPLLDRVDLQVQVAGVTKAELMQRGGRAESTATVAARVREARARAAARLVDTPWRTNAEVPGHELRTRWQLAPGSLADAERDLDRGLLTARGLDRVLRVAWTVADLAGRNCPNRSDVQTALTLRTGVQRVLRPTDRRNDPRYPYADAGTDADPDPGDAS